MRVSLLFSLMVLPICAVATECTPLAGVKLFLWQAGGGESTWTACMPGDSPTRKGLFVSRRNGRAG
jgi:hypothetical protein